MRPTSILIDLLRSVPVPNRAAASRSLLLIVVFVLSYATAPISFAQQQVASQQQLELEFENSVRPVLFDVCFRCHGDAQVAGGLRVDSRDALLQGGDSGAAVVPGDAEASLLIKAIARHADVVAMPPEKSQALRPEQVASFSRWVSNGAVWPASTKKFESKRHWAFEPLQVQEPPRAYDQEHPIDAFINDKIRAAGSRATVAASKAALIRRATFDLTGLPPTPEEVADFERDSSPQAFERVVDRLLDSPAYGEKWGRHWLDVVRYADTAGETADYPVPLAWRYRNYVIDAFNRDKPYDQFLQEQIAGDILALQGPKDRYAEQVIATGYLAISRRFGFDSENYHHLTIQDTIDNLGQSVLGLTLGCARCHDHKFDPVSMEDYYRLYAIFDSSRYAFPGSEQKQKVRSMAPLVPPEESSAAWRKFEQRVASLATSLERRKVPVAPAVLRSLHDMDGDFEMQAPAAGGSNGVLVSPWLYEGKIAVTNAAQSPFKNVFGRGKVGASIGADAGKYRIAQAVHPKRTADNCEEVFFNIDFRVDPASQSTGVHRIVLGPDKLGSDKLGSDQDAAAIKILVSAKKVALQVANRSFLVGVIESNEWHNLQLRLGLKDGSVTSSLVAASSVTAGAQSVVHAEVVDRMTQLGWLEIDSLDPTAALPIELDNIAIQTEPIALATTTLAADEEVAKLDEAQLQKELQTLIGLGGDFESQVVDQPPSLPWNPGPNSVVKIATSAQSPIETRFPKGSMGVQMPNRAEYDGFGVSLPTLWSAENASQIFVTFEFAIADVAAGDSGSWRFYLGHGSGNSAAIELFFNGSQLFRRSGDARDAFHSLRLGQWNQVELTLDMKSRTYVGQVRSGDVTASFEGAVASGWDGSVDYSFIDSYGHLGGVRPAIHVDNYEVRDTPFQTDLVSAIDSEKQLARLARVKEIQEQIAASKRSTERDWNELKRLLVEGPFEMAYAVSEGTPHEVAIQLRGEPSQPGARVSRGFVKVLGSADQPAELPANSPGSGRAELARWLTRPDNPLTARVMVNRIWQHHFGRGLVKTPNDFGLRGMKPTHPELLDYLASEFMRRGWSIKAMHRWIMQSETYRRSCFAEAAEGESADRASHQQMSDEDLYASFSRRRLSAEEIRDAILAVSGELDRDPGKGHPFPSPIDFGFTQHGPFNAVYDHSKRSVYLMTQRLKRHPFLALFDGADPNSSTPNRLGTTVPTQALYFLNDPFVHRCSEAWARRLLSKHADLGDAIREAYLVGLSRSASESEMESALQWIELYREELAVTGHPEAQSASMAALLRTLLASNEFLYVD